MTISTSRRRGLRAGLLAGGAAAALMLSSCGSSSTPTTSAGGSAAASAVTSAAGSMAAGASSAAGSAMSGASSAAGSMAAGASSAAGSAAPGSSAPGSSMAMTGPAPAALSAADIAAAKATLTDNTKLSVCTSLPYPPFEGDDGTGKIVGFDIDFMDLIAKALGVTTKTVVIDFSGIKSGQAMASKKCDLGAAAMTINPERQAVINFSDPYYDASQALMVKSSSTVTDLSGLKGQKLGAQASTTGLAYAQAHATEFGYTVEEYQTISDEEQALQTGAIAAAIHDQPALNDYFKQQKGSVKIVKSFNTGEQYGFGAAKGNTALIKVVNNVIAKSKSDGSYTASFKKWIDSSAG